jgi:hypothetical protein
MDGDVKLEIEFGDIEVAYEGPAEFARTELVRLVGELVDKLAAVENGFEPDDDDDDDEEDEEATAKPEVPKGAH